MKKAIFIVFFLFAFQSIKAQPGNLQIGIEGGPNAATISSLGTNGLNNKYCLGISGQYHFKDFCIVKLGLTYEKKGFSDPQDAFIRLPWYYTGSGKVNMDYIVLPIMAKATYTKRAYIFGEAGIYAAYLINASTNLILTDDSNRTITASYNSLSSYQRFDAGACMGIGAGIKLWQRLVLEIEGKLNIGLARIDYHDLGHPGNQSADLRFCIRYSSAGEAKKKE